MWLIYNMKHTMNMKDLLKLKNIAALLVTVVGLWASCTDVVYRLTHMIAWQWLANAVCLAAIVIAVCASDFARMAHPEYFDD